jgi:hypothetical protein
LPKGAQIYTFPVGKNGLPAALVSADIDGDGRDETLVVYNERKPTAEEGSLPLIMTVLAREHDRLIVRSSVRLLGDVFFNPKIEGVDGPFVACDVTGDGRPEIVVVSGAGASVGGAMQIFSFDGWTPREIARIGGHFFRVRTLGVGRVLIEATWKDEGKERAYQWNGKAFEEVSRRTIERR